MTDQPVYIGVDLAKPGSDVTVRAGDFVTVQRKGRYGIIDPSTVVIVRKEDCKAQVKRMTDDQGRREEAWHRFKEYLREGKIMLPSEIDR